MLVPAPVPVVVLAVPGVALARGSSSMDFWKRLLQHVSRTPVGVAMSGRAGFFHSPSRHAGDSRALESLLLAAVNAAMRRRPSCTVSRNWGLGIDATASPFFPLQPHPFSFAASSSLRLAASEHYRVRESSASIVVANLFSPSIFDLKDTRYGQRMLLHLQHLVALLQAVDFFPAGCSTSWR